MYKYVSCVIPSTHRYIYMYMYTYTYMWLVVVERQLCNTLIT